MGKRTEATCNDCYFRQSGLCALVVDTICPTFRATKRGSLLPPRQARLVPFGPSDSDRHATGA